MLISALPNLSRLKYFKKSTISVRSGSETSPKALFTIPQWYSP